MTERAPRRRASKRALRAWAWITGGVAFLTPLGALAASPAPPADVAQGRERPVLVIRKITKRVVVHEQPADAPVRYVYAPSTPSSSSSTPAVASAPAPAPPAPAPPATTTGGS